MQLTNKMIMRAAQILGNRTISKTEVATDMFVAFTSQDDWVVTFWYDNEITVHAPDRRILKTVKNNFLGEIRLTVWLANQAS
jgi:hypothetical protein